MVKSNMTQKTCYKCHLHGHFARDCNQPYSTQHSGCRNKSHQDINASGRSHRVSPPHKNQQLPKYSAAGKSAYPTPSRTPSPRTSTGQQQGASRPSLPRVSQISAHPEVRSSPKLSPPKATLPQTTKKPVPASQLPHTTPSGPQLHLSAEYIKNLRYFQQALACTRKIPKLESRYLSVKGIVWAKASGLNIISQILLEQLTCTIPKLAESKKKDVSSLTVTAAELLPELITKAAFVDEKLEVLLQQRDKAEAMLKPVRAYLYASKFMLAEASDCKFDWVGYGQVDSLVRNHISELQDVQTGLHTSLCRAFDTFCKAINSALPQDRNLARWVLYLQAFCERVSQSLREILNQLNCDLHRILRKDQAIEALRLNVINCERHESWSKKWLWNEDVKAHIRIEWVNNACRRYLKTQPYYGRKDPSLPELKSQYKQKPGYKYPALEEWQLELPIYNKEATWWGEFPMPPNAKPTLPSYAQPLRWVVPSITYKFRALPNSLKEELILPVPTSAAEAPPQSDETATSTLESKEQVSTQTSKKRRHDGTDEKQPETKKPRLSDQVVADQSATNFDRRDGSANVRDGFQSTDSSIHQLSVTNEPFTVNLPKNLMSQHEMTAGNGTLAYDAIPMTNHMTSGTPLAPAGKNMITADEPVVKGRKRAIDAESSEPDRRKKPRLEEVQVDQDEDQELRYNAKANVIKQGSQEDALLSVVEPKAQGIPGLPASVPSSMLHEANDGVMSSAQVNESTSTALLDVMLGTSTALFTPHDSTAQKRCSMLSSGEPQPTPYDRRPRE